jgi:hypothetical protein
VKNVKKSTKRAPKIDPRLERLFEQIDEAYESIPDEQNPLYDDLVSSLSSAAFCSNPEAFKRALAIAIEAEPKEVETLMQIGVDLHRKRCTCCQRHHAAKAAA